MKREIPRHAAALAIPDTAYKLRQALLASHALSWRMELVIEQIPPYRQTIGDPAIAPLHRSLLLYQGQSALKDLDNGSLNKCFYGAAGNGLLGFVAPMMAPLTANVDWLGYEMALLADAMTTLGLEGGCIDGCRVKADLRRFDAQLRPKIGATYGLMYTQCGPVFRPGLPDLVGDALSNEPDAADALRAAITRTIPAIELALDDGDSAMDAQWFLFNLWTLLGALNGNVDTAIRQLMQQGLRVPSGLRAGEWLTAYNQWFAPLSGADVLPYALAGIQANTEGGAARCKLLGWLSGRDVMRRQAHE